MNLQKMLEKTSIRTVDKICKVNKILHYEVPETEKVFYERLVEALNNVYKENWDMKVLSASYLSVYIYFPEIDITNSKNNKHKIKDLFVRLDFRRGRFQAMQGDRFLSTQKEVALGYRHSHLNVFYKTDPYDRHKICFSDFCLGSSSLYYLLRGTDTGTDEEKLEFILYTIDTMLSWESIEGTPYISIDNFINSEDYAVSSDDLTFLAKQIFEKAIENEKIMDVNFRYLGNKIVVIQDEKNRDIFFKIMLELYHEEFSSNRARRILKQEFFPEESSIDKNYELDFEKVQKTVSYTIQYLYFRNKKIYKKIKNYDYEYKTKKNEEENTIDQNFFKKICRIFQESFTERACIYSFFEEKCKVDYDKRIFG